MGKNRRPKKIVVIVDGIHLNDKEEYGIPFRNAQLAGIVEKLLRLNATEKLTDDGLDIMMNEITSVYGVAINRINNPMQLDCYLRF